MGWFARIRDRLNARSDRPAGILSRLRRDQRGATLAMMAAAVIPMIGVVGGAVDISRAYLVKVRLQQACDAGVLAARRTMTGSSVANDTNAKTQAANFFKINLKNGAYGATVTPITVTDVTNNGVPTGTVAGTASASVPTTLMKVFGKTSIAMNASCEATLQVANNDVMFVLDVTGSMNCAAYDTSSCGNNGGVEKTDAKIKAVRTAVVDFYDTLAAATTSTAQLRVGIMPYSANVNVGKLLTAANPAWIASSAPYQTRLANYKTPDYPATGSSTTAPAVEFFNNGKGISQANCAAYGQNNNFWDSNGGSFSASAESGGGPKPTSTWTKNFYNNAYSADWGYSGATDTSGSAKSCRRYFTQTTTTYKTVYKWDGTWSYMQDSFDTSGFKGGSAVIATGTTGTVDVAGSYNPLDLVSAPGATGLTKTSYNWNGCIEERKTVTQASFSSIPNGAYDLNIDMIPTTDPDTQWKPSWPQVQFDRNSTTNELNVTTDHYQPIDGGADYVPCPKQAMKLTVTTKSAVSAYVNASDFKAVGGTYHDVGLIWGARFLSPTGIFSAENASAPNGLPINRSIVFMTDGDMAPTSYTYSLYGYEKIDQRISGGALSELKARHNSRFNAICEAIKDMNITLYVVAYAQSMTPELQACATSGKAFYAADDDDLKAAFQQIAKQIAQLRLSK
jgi:Flp pilus assembly protein TadG